MKPRASLLLSLWYVLLQPLSAAPEFEPTWESLGAYECPEWFRDAKLGMWAIIGPQCVPMQGDWYARHMYIEGHRQNKYHVEHYGHPSEFGYKDIIELFNPEKLDYDRLLGLYKEAGAKYAVILAVHHDNFDLWNSTHHEWNSVKKGPKRDLVGEFRDATRKHGLRFGVTTHLARSYTWMQTNKGADKKGSKAGVPYDGNNPENADLYHPPYAESSRYPADPPKAWSDAWFFRVKDLIDQYQPDLMYFDGGYPFADGEVGRRLVAHYYNANASWHGGRNEAAMCIKKWPGDSNHGQFRDGTCVRDVERGGLPEIDEHPWQTDTCIGQWYYRTGVKYKSVGHVVQMLVDIVSKNGNLLLNVPLHPDGSIDAEEEALLQGMGAWMKVNGEALYGTRPWRVFGEGPTKVSSGHFKEEEVAYTGHDMRFAVKGDSLFAYVLAWPEDGKVTVISLANGKEAEVVESVSLVGHKGALEWARDGAGLHVELPEKAPCDCVFTLEIGFKK